MTSSTNVLRPIWRLAAPVLLGQVLNTLVGLVDMYLAGQYLRENSYLAAINLMVYLLWILPNLFSAVAIGATALVACAPAAAPTCCAPAAAPTCSAPAAAPTCAVPAAACCN